MMRSVESELMICFEKLQERLLMKGYDVEFKNKDEIIEKVSKPILDIIRSAFFSEIIVQIVVKPEQSNPLVGKFTFGNSMDPIEDFYFQMSEYYRLYANGNYIEFNFVFYDYEVYKDIYSSEDEEIEIPKGFVDEIFDEHIEAIKNILKAYDIKAGYDDVLNSATFKMPLKVEIKMFLV